MFLTIIKKYSNENGFQVEGATRRGGGVAYESHRKYKYDLTASPVRLMHL